MRYALRQLLQYGTAEVNYLRFVEVTSTNGTTVRALIKRELGRVSREGVGGNDHGVLTAVPLTPEGHVAAEAEQAAFRDAQLARVAERTQAKT